MHEINRNLIHMESFCQTQFSNYLETALNTRQRVSVSHKSQQRKVMNTSVNLQLRKQSPGTVLSFGLAQWTHRVTTTDNIFTGTHRLNQRQ